MKQFTYVIQDPLGIHARPAGALVKAAKPFADTAIQVVKGDKSVKATQLMKLMGLGVKTGDEITVTAEGPSEEAAIRRPWSSSSRRTCKKYTKRGARCRRKTAGASEKIWKGIET